MARRASLRTAFEKTAPDSVAVLTLLLRWSLWRLRRNSDYDPKPAQTLIYAMSEALLKKRSDESPDQQSKVDFARSELEATLGTTEYDGDLNELIKSFEGEPTSDWIRKGVERLRGEMEDALVVARQGLDQIEAQRILLPKTPATDCSATAPTSDDVRRTFCSVPDRTALDRVKAHVLRQLRQRGSEANDLALEYCIARLQDMQPTDRDSYERNLSIVLHRGK